MTELSKQRTDLTQSSEDFARVMEDYFHIIPPFLEKFDLNKIVHWEYDDIENTMSLKFGEEWDMNDLREEVGDNPNLNRLYKFEDCEDVDESTLTIKITGLRGGLK